MNRYWSRICACAIGVVICLSLPVMLAVDSQATKYGQLVITRVEQYDTHITRKGGKLVAVENRRYYICGVPKNAATNQCFMMFVTFPLVEMKDGGQHVAFMDRPNIESADGALERSTFDIYHANSPDYRAAYVMKFIVRGEVYVDRYINIRVVYSAEDVGSGERVFKYLPGFSDTDILVSPGHERPRLALAVSSTDNRAIELSLLGQSPSEMVNGGQIDLVCDKWVRIAVGKRGSAESANR